MQLTIVSLLCVAILTGGVDADAKECQEIKNNFLDCTTKWDRKEDKNQFTWISNTDLIIHSSCPFLLIMMQGTWDVQRADWNRGGWPTRFCCKEGLQLYGERHTGYFGHLFVSWSITRLAIVWRTQYRRFLMILQSWHEIQVGNYDMCSQKNLTVNIFRHVEAHLKENVSHMLR